MKHAFTSSLLKIANADKKVILLTGDLGYNMLETFQENMGDRFVNAGVAEQNMVSVAAGMAHMGLKPWVYSIAPFVTLKVVEQVRNDVCHLDLSVKIVGNGGGYGYGIMGATHHLLEDIAIFSSLPNMALFSPAFIEDVQPIVEKMYQIDGPAYMRMNLAKEHNLKLPRYAGVRNLIKGSKVTVVVLGHLVHNVLDSLVLMKSSKGIDLWVITEIPFKIGKDLEESLKKTKKLIIIEEHSNIGGVGEKLMSALLMKGIRLKQITHLYAKGYPSQLYGNQQFHWKENKLDPQSIAKLLPVYL